MANNKSVNLTRVVSEYFMMKSVLKNQDVQNILNGSVPSAGASSYRDEKTLKQMMDYVNELGQMKIASKMVKGKAETFDSYVERLMNDFISKETMKDPKDRINYSENPFEEGFVNLVSGFLSMENAEDKIKQSLALNIQINDKIAALPVLLGGKKQSSYIKLLSQYTEIYSNISGLQNEIAVLKESGNAKSAEIERLNKELAKEIARAEEYKKMARKVVNVETSQDLKSVMALISQTVKNMDNKLSNNVAVQGRATRKHVTAEADRVINSTEQNMYKKEQIRKQILNHPSLYPNYISISKGRFINLKKGSTKVLEEVKRAAQSVNIPEEHLSVEAVYNDLVEKNLANEVQDGSNKHTGVKVVAGILGFAIVAGGAFAGGYLFNNAQQPSSAEMKMSDDEAYQAYADNENAQRDDFVEKLNKALEDGTFYSFENLENVPNFANASGSTEEVDLENPSVMDVNYFKALRDHYAKDDNIEEYKWSSTREMDALTSAAMQTVLANYYETNYANLLSLISSIDAQILDIAQQLQTNGQVDILEPQTENIQRLIDEIQNILDAAQNKYDSDTSELQRLIDELQQKLDDANQRIEELENENADLREENARLKEQVTDLTNQLSDLLEQINQLKYENSVLSTEKATLQTQIYRYETQIMQLQERVQLLEESEAAELLAQIEVLQGLLDQANATIAELQSTNEALTQQIVELNSSIDQLNNDVSALEEAVNSLTEENNSLKDQVSSLQASLTESINSYNELLSKYNQLKENGGSSEEIEALRAELTAAYNKISAYENKIVALYNGLTKSNSTSEEAMKDIEELLKLFGIDYSDQGSSSYSSSTEYEPGE